MKKSPVFRNLLFLIHPLFLDLNAYASHKQNVPAGFLMNPQYSDHYRDFLYNQSVPKEQRIAVITEMLITRISDLLNDPEVIKNEVLFLKSEKIFEFYFGEKVNPQTRLQIVHQGEHFILSDNFPELADCINNAIEHFIKNRAFSVKIEKQYGIGNNGLRTKMLNRIIFTFENKRSRKKGRKWWVRIF